MLLSLVLLSGLSLQAMETGSEQAVKTGSDYNFPESEPAPSVSLFGRPKIRQDEVDPLTGKKRSDWRRLKYVAPFLFIPMMISFATAKSKYRFVGPLSGAAGTAIVINRLNKADRGILPPFWTHPAWDVVAAVLGASFNILMQSAWRNDTYPSFGTFLSDYFDFKR